MRYSPLRPIQKKKAHPCNLLRQMSLSMNQHEPSGEIQLVAFDERQSLHSQATESSPECQRASRDEVAGIVNSSSGLSGSILPISQKYKEFRQLEHFPDALSYRISSLANLRDLAARLPCQACLPGFSARLVCLADPPGLSVRHFCPSDLPVRSTWETGEMCLPECPGPKMTEQIAGNLGMKCFA